MKSSFLPPAKAAILLFLCTSGLVTSCDFSYSRNSSKTTETVSSIGSGYRKISSTVNGNSKSMESNQMFHFKDGEISNYTEGFILKLKEERDGVVCNAELVEQDGILKLEVKEDALIKAYYDNDIEWLDDFLQTVIVPESEHGMDLFTATFNQLNDAQSLKTSINNFDHEIPSSEVKVILEELQDIPTSLSRSQILETLLDKKLDDMSQVAVAESIFNQISMSSAKTSLVLKLIEGQELSQPCKEYLVDHIDMISMSSDREEVLMALVKK